MIFIAEEDANKLVIPMLELIKVLGNGAKKTEYEVELGDIIVIANILGYWVGDLIRIDIKFKD